MTTRNKHYLYKRWYSMLYNCYNPSSSYYIHYANLGIQVYSDWRPMKIGFDRYRDYVIDTLGELPNHDAIIRRIDSDCDFEPGNLCWSTYQELGNHRRTNNMITWQGRTQSLADWCRELNINYDKTFSRLKDYGYTIERAFND